MTFSKHIQITEKAEKSWLHEITEYVMILNVGGFGFFLGTVCSLFRNREEFLLN